MKTHFAFRTVRTLVVLAVILFLAASTAMAGDRPKAGNDEKKQRTVVVVINTAPREEPGASLIKAKEKTNVSYMLIQNGVELLKRSLRWIRKDGSKEDTWILFFRSK